METTGSWDLDSREATGDPPVSGGFHPSVKCDNLAGSRWFLKDIVGHGRSSNYIEKSAIEEMEGNISNSKSHIIFQQEVIPNIIWASAIEK